MGMIILENNIFKTTNKTTSYSICGLTMHKLNSKKKELNGSYCRVEEENERPLVNRHILQLTCSGVIMYSIETHINEMSILIDKSEHVN